MQYIDLSVPLTGETPVYPGDPDVEIIPVGNLEQNGYLDHKLTLGSHNGTHIDAPIHMLENGKSLGEYSIDRFIGQGKLVNARNGDFTEILNSTFDPGDIVIIDTGSADNFLSESYFKDYPVLSEEAANKLIESGVKMVGIDTCSFENVEGFPIHKKLLASDILLIENLTNLEALSGKEFNIFAPPLNVNIDGAPSRVIAEVKG